MARRAPGTRLNNYVGAKLILQAIDKAKGFEPDTIVKAAKGIDVKDGVTAVGYGFKFGKNNQNERAAMMGMQWQGGKLVTVYPPAPPSPRCRRASSRAAADGDRGWTSSSRCSPME